MQKRIISAFAAAAVLSSLSTVAAAAPADLPEPPRDSDFYFNGAPDADVVELGRLLFFDKVLSGNLNISCATCHHALTDTGDGLSLPVGEGGSGLGVTRNTGFGADAIPERVPRNAPPIFNLGAKEFQRMFHDGRVTTDRTQPSGFFSPAGDDLPFGLDNVLAVQAMFPVTSGAEMAGQPGENPIADAAAAGDLAGPDGVWAQLAERLRGIDEYAKRFMLAFDLRSRDDITFVHAANAIAAFEAVTWRADNSPFDRYLRGDKGAISKNQKRGMKVFYDSKLGNCASCHGGPFQTDHSFHAIALPQIGPGKGDGVTGHEDFGREQVTGNARDRHHFRVPTLRNVALTAPYGHSGAFDTLEGIVRHHLDAVSSLNAYDTSQAKLPPRPDLNAIDFLVHNDLQMRAEIAAACEIESIYLREKDIQALMEFLHALTDTSTIDLRADVPWEVPSGIPLAD
jgi:cytochrome c peroxidase